MRCVNNGIVQAISFFYTGRSIDHEINRWPSKYKNITKIPCLDIVLRYNKYMGGVDLCDMLNKEVVYAYYMLLFQRCSRKRIATSQKSKFHKIK